MQWGLAVQFPLWVSVGRFHCWLASKKCIYISVRFLYVSFFFFLKLQWLRLLQGELHVDDRRRCVLLAKCVRQTKVSVSYKIMFSSRCSRDQQRITTNSEVYVGSPPACAKIIIRSRQRIHDKTQKYASHALDHLLVFDLLMFRSETLCEERIIGEREEQF